MSKTHRDLLKTAVRTGSADAQELAVQAGPAAVPWLQRQMLNENSRIRLTAFYCLLRIGGPHIMDTCVRALYDTQPQIRAGAVREIYEHGDCTHVKPLLEAYANSRDGRARYDIDAFGQQDAGSLSFYDDFRTVFGALAADRLAGVTQISKCTGWWRPYLRLAILTERPSGLSGDSRGQRELTCAWSACCRLAPFSLAADASD